MDEPLSTFDLVALRDFAAILRRRVWLLAIVAIAVLGSAVALTAIQPKTYTAESVVLIRTNTNQQLFPLSEAAGTRLTRTVVAELEFTKTDSFAALVPSSYGTETRMLTFQPDESNTIVFRAEGPDPDAVVLAADVWASTYMQSRYDFDITEVTASIALLQNAIDELATERDELLEPLAPLDRALAASDISVDDLTLLNSQRFALLQSLNDDLAPIEAEMAQLQSRLSTLEVDQQFIVDVEASARVARAARLPTAPISPNWVRNMLYGALAAFFAVTVVAMGAENLTDRIRDAAAVAQASDLPVLGELPVLSNRAASDLMATLLENNGSFVEAMQSIVTSIQILDRTSDLRVIMVSSADPDAGKSTVATALASLLARQGETVALLDTDMRKPTLHLLHDLANRRGLRTYVDDRAELGDIIFNPPATDLVDVIPAGPPTNNAVELLRSKRFATLIDELRTKYDRVIIDTAPILPVADPLEVANHVDAAIVVARIGRARRSDMQKATLLLRSTGVRILGVVANGSEDANDRYGHYSVDD